MIAVDNAERALRCCHRHHCGTGAGRGEDLQRIRHSGVDHLHRPQLRLRLGGPGQRGQVILDLKKMNKIIHVDPDLCTALVEPG